MLRTRRLWWVGLTLVVLTVPSALLGALEAALIAAPVIGMAVAAGGGSGFGS